MLLGNGLSIQKQYRLTARFQIRSREISFHRFIKIRLYLLFRLIGEQESDWTSHE